MDYPACGLYFCTPWLANEDKTFQYLQSGYVFPQEPLLNWENAEKRCEELGGSLASAVDEAENSFIFDLNPQPDKVRWIGGRRTRAPDGARDVIPYTWTWSDGASFDIFDTIKPRPGVCTKADKYKCLFPQDQQAEPNDFQGHEDCLSMGRRQATMPANWNDEWCELKFQFVCKRPYDPSARCEPVPFKINSFRGRLFQRVLEAQDSNPK